MGPQWERRGLDNSSSYSGSCVLTFAETKRHSAGKPEERGGSLPNEVRETKNMGSLKRENLKETPRETGEMSF